MGCLHVRLDPTAKLDTVYFWHHDVTDNQVRVFLYRFPLSFLAVCRFNNLIEQQEKRKQEFRKNLQLSHLFSANVIIKLQTQAQCHSFLPDSSAYCLGSIPNISLKHFEK